MSAVEIISFLDSSKRNYSEIWDFQKLRVDQIVRGEAPESILFCEHELLATSGRRAKPGNILDSTIPVYEIERGGDITLHAPGQLVVYPLFRLNGTIFKTGLGEYLRFCEEIVIQMLLKLGLKAGRFGPTGVWIEKGPHHVKKIASIGVAVRRWVTYHGIAINVSNDLAEFNRIRPCDFESSVMTSLAAEGVAINLGAVKALLLAEIQTQLALPERTLGGGTELFNSVASF